MYGIYEDGEFKQLEYIPIENYLQYGKRTDFCKYGGYIHPEKKEDAEPLLKKMVEDSIANILEKYHLYHPDEFRRLAELIAKSSDFSGSPGEYETKMNATANNDKTTVTRDITIKKYLGILCDEGFVMRIPMYDAKQMRDKNSPAWYMFTDIGVARYLSSGKTRFSTKTQYRYLIANKYACRGYNLKTCQFQTFGKVDGVTVRNNCSIDFIISTVDFVGKEDIIPKKFVHVIEKFDKEEIDNTLRAFKNLKSDDPKIIVTSTKDDNVKKITEYCSSFNKRHPLTVIDIETFLMGL